MRAIIIGDKEAKSLLEQLKLESMMGQSIRLEANKAVIDIIHRKFHYVVTKWLQEQGFGITGN